MKQILIAESGSGYGGSAKYLANLLPLLDQGIFSVEVVAYGDGPLIQQMCKDGWAVHEYPNWRFPWSVPGLNSTVTPLRRVLYLLLSNLQLMTLVPRIALWLRQKRFQLVHLNNEILSHLPLLIAARLAGCRTICHLHGWRHLTATEKVASRFVDQFIAVTQSGADFYSSQLRGKNVLGIPNGLLTSNEVSADGSVRQSARQKLGLRDQDILAVLVGRLIPLKGHSFFFKALAQARRNRPALHGLIVGHDPTGNGYRQKLEEELIQLGLKDCVQFLPWQDHMGPVFAASDLIVQCSVEPESFGYVALEGMSIGKPVIASKIGGLVDVIRHGETGLLVEPENVDQLSRALEVSAADEGLRIRLGEEGQKRARSFFTMERNAADIQAVYERLSNGTC